MSKIIKNVLVYRDDEWKKSDILIEGSKIALVADNVRVNVDASNNSNRMSDLLVEEIDGDGKRIIPG